MANYYASARTNYVNVTDLEGLKASLKDFQVTVTPETVTNPNKVCILSTHETGWDMEISVDNPEESEPVTELMPLGSISEMSNYECLSFEKHIMPFIDVGQVLVAFQIGNENLRYLTGWTCAYIRDEDNQVRKVEIDLNHVYERAAKELEVDVSQISIAEY